MTSRAHWSSGIGGALARRICAALRIGASGLRSSWASDRQEFVLASVGLLKRSKQARVLDGDRGAVRKIFGHREVGGVVHRPDSAVTKLSTARMCWITIGVQM